MEELKQTLVALMEKVWDANIKEDADFYDNFMIDESLGITGYGIMDKDSFIKQMRAHTGVPFTSVKMEDPKLISVTPECALLIYKVTIEALRAGQPMTLHDYATTVFVKRDGEWKGVLQQHSRIPDAQQK